MEEVGEARLEARSLKDAGGSNDSLSKEGRGIRLGKMSRTWKGDKEETRVRGFETAR